jgi:hypothetical protein
VAVVAAIRDFSSLVVGPKHVTRDLQVTIWMIERHRLFEDQLSSSD